MRAHLMQCDERVLVAGIEPAVHLGMRREEWIAVVCSINKEGLIMCAGAGRHCLE